MRCKSKQSGELNCHDSAAPSTNSPMSRHSCSGSQCLLRTCRTTAVRRRRQALKSTSSAQARRALGSQGSRPSKQTLARHAELNRARPMSVSPPAKCGAHVLGTLQAASATGAKRPKPSIRSKTAWAAFSRFRLGNLRFCVVSTKEARILKFVVAAAVELNVGIDLLPKSSHCTEPSMRLMTYLYSNHPGKSAGSSDRSRGERKLHFGNEPGSVTKGMARLVSHAPNSVPWHTHSNNNSTGIDVQRRPRLTPVGPAAPWVTRASALRLGGDVSAQRAAVTLAA
mmetsp:Transcript_121190/g.388186  ORF Transcript_121190/g.388186 Transcript_121190/m.388186 type:complete len:283 (+) Transcript_121190:125-973(+)